MLCITIFLHTDPYEHVGKVQEKKEKNSKHIHIAHTHKLHTVKKEKERNTPQHILLHLHENINKRSKWRKDRMLIRSYIRSISCCGSQTYCLTQ